MGKGDFWNIKFEVGNVWGYPISMARGIIQKGFILLYHSQ
jgi:hypothetical protein